MVVSYHLIFLVVYRKNIMMNLTAFLIVAFVCYANAEITAEQKEKLKEYHKACIVESGVNPEVVKQSRQGQFAEDEKFKIHLFCISKKIGFQNDAGEIQTGVLSKKVGAILNDQKLADQLISTCAQAKENAAETTFQTVKCFFEKSPEHISIL
uniref:Odorant-binding protein n=1 Tax=Galeruca daurica TaxID=1651263 RepID=A0A1U9W501_9CUCU|nr:odorant-binding protein [Galeruca daurica]